MKVGTDAVLLGAWSDIHGKKRGLDIGTGTGVLSLMLAQKGMNNMVAIEIDEKSSFLAQQNVCNSVFKKQIRVLNTSFQDFQKENIEKFDLIICNPPFFKNSLKPINKQKVLAKHQDTLSLEELLSGVSNLLENDGVFYCILPNSQLKEMEKLSSKHKIYINKLLFVYSNFRSVAPNRCLFLCEKKSKPLQKNNLILEKIDRHDLTLEYKELTKDFYLNL